MNLHNLNGATAVMDSAESFMDGLSCFYAQFIDGSIDEYEFSDLVDLHIELSNCAA